MPKRLILLCVPFFLSAQTFELEKIEITNETNQTIGNTVISKESWLNDSGLIQKENYLQSAPMQKQISVKNALEQAGSNGDPLGSLKTFAGVASKGDSASELYIHGSKPYETQYTINHLPIAYLYHLAGFYSIIAPEATEQIDAYLGGFDTTYYAMGAVVDITPKYPTGSGKGRVHIGMYDADFAYDGKINESTNFFIGGRRSYFDLIADKVVKELNKDENDPTKKTTFTLFPQFYDAQLIVVKTLGHHAFSLEGFLANDKFKLNDTMQKNKDPIAQGKINFAQDSQTLGARWMVAANNYSANTLLYLLNSSANSNFFDADYYVNQTNTKMGLYHESIFELKNHKPTVGFEVTTIKTDLDAYVVNPPMEDYDPLLTDQTPIKLTKTLKANYGVIFVQDLWDVTETDHLRYGIRTWDMNFQNFGSGMDPRIAYVHDFSNALSVSASIGRYSQMPQPITVIDEFGNPLIDTFEFANHFILGMQMKFVDGSSLSVEPYFKKFDNLAISDNLHNYETVGKGEAYGVDITYKKNIDNLDLIAAYTFIKAKRQLNTDSPQQYRFSGDIPHTLQLSANYRFHNGWRTSGYFKYSDGSPYTPIINTENYNYNGSTYVRPIYGEPYSERLPYTFDVDLQIAKKLNLANDKSVEFSLELMNLNAIFRKNAIGINYNDSYQNVGYDEALGFLPAFHVTYRF
ncbi:MAG: TonB-dependent receptor plug domain-containing protein [Sulfuricurvum sp.]|uniref:TonB-dependent receptor plug domain-containing protein n=1 Tax=Sulfuricurvum sp. TaxID=2025608 RepID=UPI002626C2B0|nr:TonB-dependent receptor plug domain-containing protein [Sulfuricurvum sp.]MDD2828045.1 TonB-dependent receptor plug domain-containing protein [Sulfuricurvum sp.]MDD4948078.1 TonB-dependent receptor plug domain-containing protein [Sulfuricurvum sp.]